MFENINTSNFVAKYLKENAYIEPYNDGESESHSRATLKRIGSFHYRAHIRLMWRSHQPRFHPDLNRGLYRERVGVVLSAPIRSCHVLMSILTIGLIVENFLAAKKFLPINTIASTNGTIASDRMTS